jgi:transcriptional regulator with XRE-family HTH domain
MADFAEKLDVLMTEKGLSQSALSRISGITQKTISNYLRRINRPSWGHVQAIADAMGVEVGSLRDDAPVSDKKKKKK